MRFYRRKMRTLIPIYMGALAVCLYICVAVGRFRKYVGLGGVYPPMHFPIMAILGKVSAAT